MDVVIVGPGRAGMSLALALRRSGHRIVGVLGRSNAPDAALELEAPLLTANTTLPAADLVVVAVRDDAIASVAASLRPLAGSLVVHLSGVTSVAALDSLSEAGCRIGSLHPLQSLPDPQTGATALAGSWIALTAQDEASYGLLEKVVQSIGARPFRLADEAKATYHAGAAAAANYVLAALSVAEHLMDTAGVPWEASRPLVDGVVANAFALGTRAALTGPIARGDVGTVALQREAAAAAGVEGPFVALGRLTADMAGTAAVMDEVLK